MGYKNPASEIQKRSASEIPGKINITIIKTTMIQDIIDVINETHDIDIFSANALLKKVDVYLQGPYFSSYHQLIICFINKLIRVYGDELEIGDQFLYFLIINKDVEILKNLNESNFYKTITFFDYSTFREKEIPLFILLLQQSNTEILGKMFKKHKKLTKETIKSIIANIDEGNVNILTQIDYTNHDTILSCLDKKAKNYTLLIDNLHHIGRNPVNEKVKIVYAFPSRSSASQFFH